MVSFKMLISMHKINHFEIKKKSPEFNSKLFFMEFKCLIQIISVHLNSKTIPIIT